MKTAQLDYDLPAELIAQHPATVRSDARLLVLDRDSGRLTDDRFARIGDYLRAGDCLVLNDTKVLPARFFARRRTGAKLEGLFLSAGPPDLWRVMLKGIRKLKPGEHVVLRGKTGEDFCTAEVVEKEQDGRCLLRVENPTDPEATLARIGFPPLPPYIRRDDDASEAEKDQQRYQTVYASQPGAVAAPTAGLHFTKELIARLEDVGVRFAYVTLHVGAGTFKPIATDEVEAHQIHSETFHIDEENAGLINEARRHGGRIVAVGTTATRVLETVSRADFVRTGNGTTTLFITPGYRFRIVDAMVTNFHLPRSTLLALVAAFAGMEPIKRAYQHAVDHRYRFYSYGDATLIL
jgi:S-adenosylmethionine:tRNA ribosyltransferase-isomerase